MIDMAETACPPRLRPGGFILGAAVLAAVVARIAPPAGPNHPRPIHREDRGSAVMLIVPEGESAGRLTLLDEEGRELATLVRWRHGGLTGTVPRGGGTGLGFWLKAAGGASLGWAGTEKQSDVRVGPDGTIEASVRPRPGIPGGTAALGDHPVPPR